MKFKSNLNPLLWDEDDKLHEDVKEHLLNIADNFIEYTELPEDSIVDILFLGSEASYNYNSNSDIDLHIKVDYDKVHKDCPIVDGYLWALKSLYNNNHDITIHDIPVELYAESSESETHSNGIYSIIDDKWIKEPEKIPPTNNDSAVISKVKHIEELVEYIDNTEDAEKLIDKIYNMRQKGLDSDESELSVENLAFKQLRNNGTLDKLKEIKLNDIDDKLSLEQEYFNKNNDVLLSSELDDIFDDDDIVELENNYTYDRTIDYKSFEGRLYCFDYDECDFCIKSIYDNSDTEEDRHFELEFEINNNEDDIFYMFITTDVDFEYNNIQIRDENNIIIFELNDLNNSDEYIRDRNVFCFVSKTASEYIIYDYDVYNIGRRLRTHDNERVIVKLW